MDGYGPKLLHRVFMPVANSALITEAEFTQHKNRAQGLKTDGIPNNIIIKHMNAPL